MEAALRTELWTSWASMLRVYSAAHGLNSAHHSVVEVGSDEIILRVGARTLRFTHERLTAADGEIVPFALNEDGTVTLGETTAEMDMAAEAATRGMFSAHKSP